MQDINHSTDGEMFSAERLVPQTKASGPKELGLKFAVPMFFFQGAEDFTTPTALAQSYLQALEAPRKEFVPIQGAGHFAVFMHSDQFSEGTDHTGSPAGEMTSIFRQGAADATT